MIHTSEESIHGEWWRQVRKDLVADIETYFDRVVSGGRLTKRETEDFFRYYGRELSWIAESHRADAVRLAHEVMSIGAAT